MNSAWSHLPNAKHIDRILTHLEAHPEKWAAAYTAAWAAAYTAAWGAAYTAAWAAARGAAWDVARDAAWAAARGDAWGAIAAIAALVAWDNCAHLLELTPDQLRMYSRLSDDPAAVLLLPAVIASEV